MDKLALLGSWDPQGLLDPLDLRVLGVQWDLDLRYFSPFLSLKNNMPKRLWKDQ